LAGADLGNTFKAELKIRHTWFVHKPAMLHGRFRFKTIRGGRTKMARLEGLKKSSRFFSEGFNDSLL